MAGNETDTQTPKTEANGEAAKNMPLFYSNPVPLDAKAHANLSLKKNFVINL